LEAPARQIAIKVTARGVEPHTVTVADIMSRKPIVAAECDDLNEAVQGMRISGVRRIPVVAHDDGLTGILAMDDVLEVLTGMLCDVSGTVHNEQRQERRLRVDALSWITPGADRAAFAASSRSHQDSTSPYDKAYWQSLINFQALAEDGMITRADLKRFDFADSPEEAWQWMVRPGLKAHTPNGTPT
jgi:hypothetical protein